MSLPQYYSILGITSSATSDDIRQAYRKESLRTHPDRLGPKVSAAERRRATERFQAVADAYYVLSDPQRRAEYDQIFRSRPASAFTSSPEPDEQDKASANFFEQFSQFFKEATGAAGGNTSEPDSGYSSPGTPGGTPPPGERRRPDAEGVFGDVFADLLEPEINRENKKKWSYVGGAAGAALGYIIMNIPGAIAGGYAGSRVGGIRDAKGVPVATVFTRLPASQKAQILRALAVKVLGSMS